MNSQFHEDYLKPIEQLTKNKMSNKKSVWWKDTSMWYTPYFLVSKDKFLGTWIIQGGFLCFNFILYLKPHEN